MKELLMNTLLILLASGYFGVGSFNEYKRHEDQTGFCKTMAVIHFCAWIAFIGELIVLVGKVLYA